MLKKAITRISILAIIIGSIFLANGLILAWTAPTASPTGSNVSAPLNISGTAQTKSGSLNLGGLTVSGQNVCLANGTNCPAAGAESDTLQSVTNRGNTTSQWMQSNSSMRAPLFYDSNNTGYYVDPSGSSRLNQLYYVDSAYIVDVRPQYMYDWNDSAYYIDMNNGSRLNYLGRNYGWNWTEYDWNDTTYYMDLNNVSILNDLRVNILYDRQNTGYYVDPASTSRINYGIFDNVYSYGWMQSPIFYDANNTGYYVDPASTSRINYGVFDNVYSYSWIISEAQMQAPIYYDRNNTGYYVDPASTSRMNAITPNSITLGGVSRSTWPAESGTVTSYSNSTCYWQGLPNSGGYYYCSSGYYVNGIYQAGIWPWKTSSLYCCKVNSN